jgi:hypothetical protein
LEGPKAAARLLLLAQRYEELLLREHPLGLEPAARPLRLVGLLEDSLRAAQGRNPLARRMLVEILGRVRWPMAWSTRRSVPRGEADAWTQRALTLTREGSLGLNRKELQHLRGRLFFRSGDLEKAIPLLITSPLPMDRLRLASALRTRVGHLQEVGPLIRRVRIKHGDSILEGDLLAALLLAQGGRLGGAQRLLAPILKGPATPKRERARCLKALFQALEGGPLPRAFRTKPPIPGNLLELRLPIPPPAPPSSQTPASSFEVLSWPPWILDQDLTLFAALCQTGEARKPNPDWRDRALEELAQDHSYPFQPLALRLVKGRTQ